MATLRDAVKTQIEATTTFTSIMTGGGYQSDEIDTLTGGGWDWAKENGLVVNQQIVHHWIMRWGDSTPFQANVPVLGAEQESLEIYLYAPLGGYGNLEAAVTALKAGLHNQLFESLDDRTIARCFFAMASRQIPAEEYRMTPSRFVRFEFRHQRK